jgi:hypothetical protein
MSINNKLPLEAPALPLAPLCTEVRGIGILRTSPFGRSRKLDFHFTEFSEVRYPQATPKQHQR